MRVFVYFNVRRKDFSIQALEGPDKGLVFDHAGTVEILDAEFRVSEAGRQRVLATGQKNVHAGVRGTLGTSPSTPPHEGAVRVTYNPKRDTGFVQADDRSPCPSRARRVVLSPSGCYAEFDYGTAIARAMSS
jgi:hypothetical protein